MAVKLIAVDMDGTFLSDTKEYDKKRFNEQYKKMKEKNIKFVVASGNQYYQLSSFFPDFADELTFVAENGAFIVENKKELFTAEIAKKEVDIITGIVNKIPDVNMIICGKNSAYIKEDSDDEFFKYASQYYHRLMKVSDIFKIEDKIFKFALNCPVEIADEVQKELIKIIGHILTPVSSGHGDIDLILPGINKANGLKILQKKWNIADEEILAFGDGGNDIEMLEHAYYSYVMENGNEKVKKHAKYTAPSNNNSGVLEIIDKYL